LFALVNKGKDHPVTGQEAQRVSRGIAVHIQNVIARCGWVVNTTIRPLYPLERDPVSILQYLDVPLGLDRCGEKISCPSGLRTPTWATRSESLYRL